MSHPAAITPGPTERPSQQFAVDVATLRDFLWSHAINLVRNSSEADDLVHDTIERALSCHQLYRSGNLRAWMRSIMRNIFVDGWRRNLLPADQDADQLPDTRTPPPDAEFSPLDFLRIEHVHLAAARLRPQDRELFLVVHVEGLSYRETAVRFHLTAATVGTRLFRIRGKVRAILEKITAEQLISELSRAPRQPSPERGGVASRPTGPREDRFARRMSTRLSGASKRARLCLTGTIPERPAPRAA